MATLENPNPVRQTVILCTYNRARDLMRALESLAAQRVPASENWEILVVDNGSTDNTREITESFCEKYPGRFRYFCEPHPGKSYALNTGIREARGELLAFTDDDATFAPDWLPNLTAPLRNGEWAGTGGRTLPSQAFIPPRWLAVQGPFNMSGLVAATFDMGDQPAQLFDAPYGVNMAFHRRMFEKYGGFRTDLGPSRNGDIPRPNEDTEFGRRLMSAGERLRYEPSAVAYHPPHEERMHKEFFLSWWFDAGRATVREAGRKPDIWGIPRPYLAMAKSAAFMGVRILRWLFAPGAQRRFYRKCWVWKTAGQISEMRRMWFTSAKKLAVQAF